MFKKQNGSLHLGEIQKFSGFSVNSFSQNAKKAITQEVREKFQRKFDVAVLGSFALSNKWTVEELDILNRTAPLDRITPIVIVMIGLPCSGKSTYIKENLKGFNVVSFDNAIMEEFDKNDYNYSYSRYCELSGNEKKIITLESQIRYRDLLLLRKNIAIDYTNLTKEWLDRWLDVVPSDYIKNAVVLKVPFDEILRRNENRKRKFIPVVELEKMRNRVDNSYENYGFNTVLVLKSN